MKLVILLASIVMVTSSCVKETTTKIISENPNVTEKDVPTTSDGTVNGGGGKGVKCIQNGATTVELLDLYEAKVLYGLTIDKKASTQDEAMALFIDLIIKHTWNPLTVSPEILKPMLQNTFLDQLTKKMKFISGDKKLKSTSDSFEPLIANNCEIVQVAMYYDESIILIDQSLWDQMDWVNKSALLTHEVMYARDREKGSTNSMATRKLVGQMFSSKGTRPLADGVPVDSTQFTECPIYYKNKSVGNALVYNLRQSMGPGWPSDEFDGIEFVFTYLKNQGMLFRTSAHFYHVNKEDLFKSDFLNFSSESDLFIDGYAAKQSVKISSFKEGNGIFNIIDKVSGDSSEDHEIRCRRY